jgi:hypothetical protein
LETVIKNPDSFWIREGTHHVLHDLPGSKLKEIIKPVLDALDDVEPSLEAAIAAKAAVDKIAQILPKV